MPRRISPLQDAINHVVTMTDKTSKMDVKYINPQKGRGVFSLAPFSKGDFVVEYRGDLIDFSEARRRRKLYHSSCTVFMFDFKWKGKMWCIDAAKEDGSFGRLVNDDHKHPNCRMKMTEVEGRPHLCLYAIEDIKEGDEIAYDYGGKDWPWRKKMTDKDTHFESNAQENRQQLESGSTLATCSSAHEPMTDKDTHFESNAQENRQQLESGSTLATCSSAHEPMTDKDTHFESNAQENRQQLESGSTLATCSSAHEPMTDKDTHFESNAQENRQQLESGSTLATCSSAHEPMTDKDTHFESNAQENRQQLESGSTLATCSSAHEPMTDKDTHFESNAQENRQQLESGSTLATCSSAHEPMTDKDTHFESNAQENRQQLESGSTLATCSSAHEPMTDKDTHFESNAQENRQQLESGSTLATCSSAHEPMTDKDTHFESNAQENRQQLESGSTLATCSSAHEPMTDKDTHFESNAQENRQQLESGSTLATCSSAHEPMTDKDTHFESNAQENRQQLESGSTLATCSSAHKPMIYYNPKMTARISPVSRQLEPMKDHAIDITSGQNSSSEDIVEEGVCVPRLKRTRSVIMREFNPEESDELFDSTADSEEEYIPNSREESNESSSESSMSLKPLKHSRPCSTSEALHSKSSLDSTPLGVMGVEEGDSHEVMDIGERPGKRQVMESDGGSSSSELMQQEETVVVNAVKRQCDGRRVYDKKHYCLFCLKPFSKIARHLQYVHSNEREVAVACSFPKASKQRKMHLDDLRRRGNYVHNAAVIKTGNGELVPCKRPPKKAQGTDFMHCAYCQGLFTRIVLWRHVKVCKLRPEDCNAKPGKNRVQSLCAFTQPVPSHISKALWKTLSVMNADEITATVKNDSCIIQLGEHLLNKGGSTAKTKACIRQKLRELGKLLIAGKKVASLKTIEDFIDPQNYMKMVLAVRHTCGYNSETNTYKTPSLAKKLGISLMKLSKLVKAKALIEKDHCLAQKLSSFQEIHTERWCELISATAARNLEESKWNAPTVLPFTEDVQKLHAFLNKMQDESIKQLSSEPTAKYWSDLAQVMLTQIILFNRRREGEVSSMPLSTFLSRDTSDPHGDIDWALSEVEKKLCRHFSRIVTRGKRGRPVPILLTPKMLSALELLVKNRDTCGVLKDNVYLFARPSAMSHYRGSDCIRSFAKSCNASSPGALTSTKLRKHAATLSTVLNLKDTDMDQLANFLGHDIRIHREYYRLPEKTLQLAKVSKILMALEQGRLGDFKGKNLDEINIDPNEEIEVIDDEGKSEEEVGNVEELEAPGPDLNTPSCTAKATHEGSRETPVPLFDTAVVSQAHSKTSTQKKRKAWEVEEIQAVERHLKHFIISCRVPGKAVCERCISAEPLALKNRDWQSVKFFVHNRIVAYKRGKN
ncbi:uncharacterized protein LOC143510359 isoform X2 [Brachyhypopomus gauderio]|uniref:uncharacterized protein LOC143510359 isoform X2 n=1 Tax=Brachyhypopomus gauderio TaxID=698409 RepID=UPI0040435E06